TPSRAEGLHLQPPRTLEFTGVSQGRHGVSHNPCSGFLFCSDLAQSRCLAPQLAQIVELRAAHPAGTNHFDPIDNGRVQGENAFHSLAEGGLANREGGVIPGSPLADDCAFEDLNSFLVTFFDFDVHTHGISGLERGQVFFHLQLFNLFERVHDFCSPKLEITTGSHPSRWRVSSHCRSSWLNGKPASKSGRLRHVFSSARWRRQRRISS